MTDSQMKIERGIGVAALVYLQATTKQYATRDYLKEVIGRLLDDVQCDSDEEWLIYVYHHFASLMHARGAWHG